MRPELWLYRAVLWTLLPALGVFVLIKDRVRRKQRPPLSDRWVSRPPKVQSGGVWIQAVSVGEVEIARRLIADLERRHPDLPITVTATTATGLALARRTLGERIGVCACPLDLPGPTRRMFDAIQPSLLVLVETELWPEMLVQADSRQVPVAVVNARLSEGSFARYRRVAGLLRRFLGSIALILARSDADQERFAQLGVPESKIRVAGNIKYDLETQTEPLIWAENLRSWADQRSVIVAGSTMEGEEDLVLEAIARVPGGFESAMLVLAPRHPERFDPVAERVEGLGHSIARRSQISDAPPRPDVFLLDTIGELGRAYGLAQAAFIGGSLVATGGHNPLEPAVWSVPVATGPYVHNFREVYDEMLGEGGAVVVSDSQALCAQLGDWLQNPDRARRAGTAGQRVVMRNRGATETTVTALRELLDR